MRTEKKELNIQIGKRLQTARENSGYTQETFAEALDVEMFLANCSREERDKFIDRMLAYMRKLMINPQ